MGRIEKIFGEPLFMDTFYVLSARIGKGLAEDNCVWKTVVYRTMVRHTKDSGDTEELLLPGTIREILKQSYLVVVEHWPKMAMLPPDKVQIEPVQKLFRLTALNPPSNQKKELSQEPLNKMMLRVSLTKAIMYVWPTEYEKIVPEKPHWMLCSSKKVAAGVTKQIIWGRPIQ